MVTNIWEIYVDGIKNKEMKEKIQKEYTRCMTGSQVKTQWIEYLLSYKFKGSCSSQV